MDLVLFDIDGTLTRTNPVDEKCFAEAVLDVFGIEGISTDWGAYTHSTDSGIITELIEKRLRRSAEQADLLSFQKGFLKALQTTYASTPKMFEAVPGAANIFAALRKEAGWATAIATGGWKISALYKLEKSGVGFGETAAAFADDHVSRDEIIKTSMKRAEKKYGVDSFERIVYVGDGRWDFITTKRMGIEFIGLLDERNSHLLQKEGATRFVKNYEDYPAFLKVLNAS